MQALILALAVLAGVWSAGGAQSQVPHDPVEVNDGGTPQPPRK